MPESKANQPYKQFFFGLVVVLFIAFIVLSQHKNNEIRIRNEISSLTAAAGTQTTQSIMKKAESLYNVFYVKTGFQSHIDEKFIKVYTEYTAHKAIKGMDSISKNFGQNLKVIGYQILLRLSVFAEWAITLTAFMLGCIVDAHYKRKIFLYEMTQQSTGTTRMVLLGFSVITICMAAYLLIPVNFGPMTYHFPLFYAAIISIGLRQLILKHSLNF